MRRISHYEVKSREKGLTTARQRAALRGNDLFKSLDRWAGIPLVFFAGIFTDKQRALPQEPRRILVVKLSAIGDTICLFPALRALRQRYPSSHITAVGTAINRAIFEACPFVDERITIDIRAVAKNPLSVRRDVSGTFDLAIDFDQWTRLSPLIAFMSGAAFRIGFKTSGQFRHYLYHRSVEHRSDRHEIDCFIDALSPLGIHDADPSLTFSVPSSAAQAAYRIMQDAGITAGGRGFVIIHPETPAHGPQRQWPPERYVDVGRHLTRNGYQVILSGTARDTISNKRIAEEIGGTALLLPVCTLIEFAAVLRQARLMICGNTGVMHLAAAMDVPLIALHGPTDARKWGPRSEHSIVLKSPKPCSPCLYLGFEYGCHENVCMRDIPAALVAETAVDMLKRFEKSS